MNIVAKTDVNKRAMAVRTYGGTGQGGRMATGWADALVRRGYDINWINVFEPDALDRILACDAFFCTTNQDSPRDLRYLGSLLEVVERSGCKVFPDRHSRWHFDDKISQVWLFRSLGIPAPQSWVFFDHKSAREFVRGARFPLVFKLAAGAGSENVKLVAAASDASKLVDRMFGAGMTVYPLGPRLRKGIRKNRPGSFSISDIPRLTRAAWNLVGSSMSRANRDRGYVLFQEFVPDNDCDYRVTVIGNRAFVFRRRVRDNDFRASGSGRIFYPDAADTDPLLVRLAFAAQEKLKGDCIAMDFVYDKRDGLYKLLEVSSGFIPEAVRSCKGYFDRELNWFPGNWSPQECMVADVLATICG